MKSTHYLKSGRAQFTRVPRKRFGLPWSKAAFRCVGSLVFCLLTLFPWMEVFAQLPPVTNTALVVELTAWPFLVLTSTNIIDFAPDPSSCSTSSEIVDPISYSTNTPPTNGTVFVHLDSHAGEFLAIYSPNPGYIGDDFFVMRRHYFCPFRPEYTEADVYLPVLVHVVPPPPPPPPHTNTLQVVELTALPFLVPTSTNIIGAALDPSSCSTSSEIIDPISYSTNTPPTNGTVFVHLDSHAGEFLAIYSPNPGYIGDDFFVMRQHYFCQFHPTNMQADVYSPVLVHVRRANRSPVAKCKAIVMPTGMNCVGSTSVDDGSFDPDGDPLTVSQLPPGPYPLGTNMVTLTVSDDHGHSVSCSTTITVVDVPPSLACPSNIVVYLTNAAGVAVSYLPPSATDPCYGTNVPVVCQPPSGSLFQLGTNLVSCSATNSSGNTGSCSFVVTVLGPRTILVDVLAKVTALRASTSGKKDLSDLDQIISGLVAAVDPSLWVDDAHLQRGSGHREFDALPTALQAFSQILGRDTSLPKPTLLVLLERVENAEQIVASIAIQQAATAGAAAKRIDAARQKLDLGDQDAAAGRSVPCVGHYKDAWETAAKALVVQTLHIDSHVHLKILGYDSQTHQILGSTNLVNWTILATVKADSSGVINFDAGSTSAHPVRFYRVASP